ncbi:glutamate--tRNA ligase, partial [Salibacteraceae bacterium]|nr:glutamate--tRNA ligase [Salibacteraceae bacterium]
LTDLEPYLRDDQRAQGDDFLVEVIDMMKERSSFVQDILQGEYFFSAPTEYDEKTSQKKWKEGSADLMQGWVEELRKMDDFSEENIDAAFHTYIESKEVGLGQLLPIFRLLVTGQGMGPSMFRIAALLGQDECVSRIELGLSKLS